MLLLMLLSQIVPVYDYPEGEAYLLYRLLPDGTALVALSLDGEEPFTGYVPYPSPFNPGKTDVFYRPGDSSIEVASQLPYSAVYSTAVYSLTDQGLLLLDSGMNDPYAWEFQEVMELLGQGRLSEAASAVDMIMYPQAMPNGRELCVYFLDAAFRCARSGGGVECFHAADEASQILLGRSVHEIVQPGESLPEGCMSRSDYNGALEAYARALEAAGNTSMAGRVRQGMIR